ncbi:MAG: hypothetical protein H6R26_2965 [Proteobacteria bacterium]|nr:hypothetical protein [Pseudomonadota bacterium]
MATNPRRDIVEKALARGNGILRLEPAWVARDFLPPGYRLGLKEEEYEVGERGWISERWIGSTTQADNRVGPPDEGLSYLTLEGEAQRVTLKEAIEVAAPAIMGEAYAKTHKGLGRLAKIYDFAARIPYHIHQRQQDAALVGRNSKEEAYYFPEGVDVGPHPETFFGVHPSIVERKQYDVLLPYMVDWNSDLILRHSRAYLLVPGEGFHLPAGGLHAPGTALTIELQEDSDVFAMLQALVAGKIISKELLFKDVRKEDRERLGERAILNQVDWEVSGDPYFYENRHMSPQLAAETQQAGGEEYWIYYNTTKFSGKKLVVRPGQRFRSVDKGVYNVLVWRGRGRYDGHEVKAGDFGYDELLVSHAKATTPLWIENTGDEDLMIIKFFGPDINLDVPMIPQLKP